MSRLEWQTGHALADGQMDDMHREFVTLVNLLAVAHDEEEADCLQQLVAHCRTHFAQEDLWMRESRIASADKHRRDHDAVLSLLQSAQVDVDRGHAGAGRAIAESLASWFERHGETLDAALAFQMQARTSVRHENVIPAIG